MRGKTFKSYLQSSFAECICSSCERKGCKLVLDSLDTHHLIIIDADEYKKREDVKGRICDFFLFYLAGGTSLAIVELKSGLVKALVAKAQVENSSRVAFRIMDAHTVSNFLPIILYGRGISRLDSQVLRQVKVRFQGKDWMIIVEPCGSHFTEIISKYSVA